MVAHGNNISIRHLSKFICRENHRRSRLGSNNYSLRKLIIVSESYGILAV